MRLPRSVIAVAAGLAFMPGPAAAASTQARQVAERGLEALGGADRLRALETVRLHAMVLTNAIEQSVRPEGPYFENYSDVVETRWLERMAMLSESRSRGTSSQWWLRSDWAPSTTLVQQGAAFAIHDGKVDPARAASVAPAEESLALGPERVLLTALAAADLHLAGQESLHGHEHDILAFTWRGVSVKVFLLSTSKLPVAVEYSRARPLDILFAPWGDISTRIEWDAWMLEANGLHYPRHWQAFVNGYPFETRTIDQVEFNPPDARPVTLEQSQLEAARERAAVQDAAFDFQAGKAVDVAPGVHLYQGPWNVTAVRIGTSTYMIEAPISGAFSRKVINQLRSEGRPITGIITTSDSWPHVGGVREYVADGIPVIALDLNAPLLKRLVEAPHRTFPDSLAKKPQPLRLMTISTPTEIGTGSERMRLIPFRTATGERQMAIYWPAHKLLYTSDIMTARETWVWLPQYCSEVAELIEREGLKVERVFGMHYAPASWAEVQRLPAMGS